MGSMAVQVESGAKSDKNCKFRLIARSLVTFLTPKYSKPQLHQLIKDQLPIIIVLTINLCYSPTTTAHPDHISI